MAFLRAFIIAWIFLLPFHAFGVTFVNALLFGASSHAPFWMSAWKEIILLIFFLLSSVVFIRYWRKILSNINWLDGLIVLFSVVAIAIGSVHSSSLFQVFLGIKYDLFFLWIFLVARHLALLFPDFFQKLPIEKTIFASGLIILAFAFWHQFLPSNFLVQFGYFADASVDTTQKPASFCQLLEHTTQCRWQSLLAGPIRFGAFLVLFFGVLFRIPLRTFFKVMILTFGSIALFFTYSRAAWVSALVFFSSFSLFSFRNVFLSRKILIAIGSGLCIFLLSLWGSGLFSSLIIRESSSSLHWQGLVHSIDVIQNNPWGMGLGMAGPASTHLPEHQEFLNENWYLQIFTEIGFLGGMLFLMICVLVLHMLFQKDKTLFAMMLAFMTMALFTHVWEESSVAYLLWLMAGMASAKTIQKQQNA